MRESPTRCGSLGRSEFDPTQNRHTLAHYCLSDVVGHFIMPHKAVGCIPCQISSSSWWNKKAQLTQGLHATAVRVYRHLGFLKFKSCTISLAIPENPTLEPNSMSIGKPVANCEVMAIFVYPRWPSAAILDFI